MCARVFVCTGVCDTICVCVCVCLKLWLCLLLMMLLVLLQLNCVCGCVCVWLCVCVRVCVCVCVCVCLGGRARVAGAYVGAAQRASGLHAVVAARDFMTFPLPSVHGKIRVGKEG